MPESMRLPLLLGITLILAALVAVGLTLDKPSALVAFVAWCGGVLFTLLVQQILVKRIA